MERLHYAKWISTFKTVFTTFNCTLGTEQLRIFIQFAMQCFAFVKEIFRRFTTDSFRTLNYREYLLPPFNDK